jgi:hypothetical protein
MHIGTEQNGMRSCTYPSSLAELMVCTPVDVCCNTTRMILQTVADEGAGGCMEGKEGKGVSRWTR